MLIIDLDNGPVNIVRVIEHTIEKLLRNAMSYAIKNYGTHSLMTLPFVKTLHKGSFDNALFKIIVQKGLPL